MLLEILSMEFLGIPVISWILIGFIFYLTPIFLVVCRLGRISLTLQEINKKLGEKPEGDKVEDKSSAL